MSKEGENEIKALERATKIQRLFHKFEEMRRQYRASPTDVKAAKLMGERARTLTPTRNVRSADGFDGIASRLSMNSLRSMKPSIKPSVSVSIRARQIQTSQGHATHL